MKLVVTTLLFGVLLTGGCASASSGRPWKKEQVVSWYGDGQGPVRFIGYQGSDAVQHHFIARVMDTWTFLQISKEDLRLPEELAFPSASSAQLYYYLVDPARDFAKLEPKKEANQSVQGTPGKTSSPPAEPGVRRP